MIDAVTFARTTFAEPPARFEAGTPHIVGAVGLHAAVSWVEKLSLDAIHAHECALVAECRHFVTCALDGTRPATDYREGAAVVAALEAANASRADGGARVTVARV